MKAIRDFLKREDGSTMIEFGLVGAVYIFSIVALMDVARGFYIYNRLDYAADKMSRAILIEPSITQEALPRPAALDGLNSDNLDLTLVGGDVGGVSYKTLTLRYPLSMFSPMIGRDQLSLQIERRVYAAGTDS